MLDPEVGLAIRLGDEASRGEETSGLEEAGRSLAEKIKVWLWDIEVLLFDRGMARSGILLLL